MRGGGGSIFTAIFWESAIFISVAFRKEFAPFLKSQFHLRGVSLSREANRKTEFFFLYCKQDLSHGQDSSPDSALPIT